MLRKTQPDRGLTATGLRFGIVAARYNPEFSDTMANRCLETLAKAGADMKRTRLVRVPGTFEVTAAAAKLASSGKYDCIIGLGILMQGETSHAHHIADAVAHGLTNISIKTGIPAIFGVVTANNPRQARVRCLGKEYNRGHEAALTAIEMAVLWKSL